MANSSPSVARNSGPPQGIERRGFPRYPCGREVALHSLSSPERLSHWALAVDVSRGGVCLLLSCPFHDSLFLSVEVPGRHGRVVHRLGARIVRERVGLDGNTYLGCAFEPLLSQEVLDSLLGC